MNKKIKVKCDIKDEHRKYLCVCDAFSENKQKIPHKNFSSRSGFRFDSVCVHQFESATVEMYVMVIQLETLTKS